MIISNLFYYKILFAVEMLTAEFLFTFRLKKRGRFALRAVGCATLFVIVAAVFPTPVDSPWYSSFMFLAMFAMTVPMLKFCYNEPWVNMLFCGVAAYTLQHFSYELASVVLSAVFIPMYGENPMLGIYSTGAVDMFAFDKKSLLFFLFYLLSYIAAYSLGFALFGNKIRRGRDMKVRRVSMLFLVCAGLLTDIILNAVVVYLVTDPVSVAVGACSNMLCCVLLMYAQFGLLYAKELESEIDVAQRLLREETEQYAMLKENMDLINMKCHDMRHQIREIGRSKRLSADTIAEIENSVRLYDSVVKTGNDTLDVIITEKSLRCHSSGIVLSCIADGSLLGFMSEGELYSLFGNAIDNAIEAVMKISDSDRRVIGLRIHAAGEMITVCLQNPYADVPEFGADGLPVTTKADVDHHGFGMKSMAYTVDKYGGDLSVVAREGMFRLNILLPMGGGPSGKLQNTR